MSEKKKTETERVSDFITKTGFILEMEVSEILIKMGYQVKVNRYFYDFDTDKDREIDIIATKIINGVEIFLVLECKQSLVDSWIFVCSDRKPSRYYQYVKHFPQIPKIDKTKVFDNFHFFENTIPLAQNNIIKDKCDKKSNSIQIDTCLEKLPKALIHTIYNNKNTSVRRIFVPIAIFNGEMFTAQYNKRLSVKGVDWVQYQSGLNSEGYKYDYTKDLPRTFRSTVSFDNDFNSKSLDIKPNTAISKTAHEQGSMYLIDFVTKKGLKKLIAKLELDVKSINHKDWPLPTEN